MNQQLAARARFLSCAFVLCLPALLWAGQPGADGSRPAGEAAVQSQQRQAEVVKLESVLNDAERNHDLRCLQQTFADDLIYVAFNGAQLTKQKLLDGLSGLKITSYAMKNFSLKQLGPNTALLTYDLEVKGSVLGSDLPPKSRATSIWESRDGRWQLIYHGEVPQKHSLLTKLFF